MGLFFGNWGLRGSVASKADQKQRRTIHDRQVLKQLGQIKIMAEASPEIEELLKQPEMEGRSGGEGLESRSTTEYYVVRGNEPSALLIASRMDNTSSLECMKYEIHNDHEYNEKKTNKWRGRGS